MSHHGSDRPDFDPARKRLMEELLNTSSFRGALDAFPHGQLSAADEGAIQFGVGEKDGKVVLDFGKPVAWLAMTPQDAADLASTLLKQARTAARKSGQTVGFTIG